MSKQKISTAAVDRIGNLPDDILIYILSSLPIEQAVATSILSKRWIHLWCYLPDLNFTGNILRGKSILDFYEFLHSVLRSREAAGNHSINTFIIHPEYFEHRVLPKLPLGILTCKTLVVLKLHWISYFIDVDSLLNLPSLKTLHLENICFRQQREFMRLLDACPVLEDVKLSHINFLMWSYHYYFDDFETSSMLRKLNRADITACQFYFPVDSLSNSEFLRIQLSKAYHPYDFPTFHNLTHLMLNYAWDIVVQALHQCPKLQNLELYEVHHTYYWDYMDGFFTNDYQESWADPKFVPSCLSSNLTTCTMRDFACEGLHRNHITIAKLILKNARVLQTMTIWCSSKRSEIESQLSVCPSASATCQLSIY